MNVPLGAIAVVTILFTIPGSTNPGLQPREARRSIDWAGTSALCGWLGPLLLALTWVRQSGWSAPLILGLLIASAMLLVVFLLVESRAKEPLLSLNLFRDPHCAGMLQHCAHGEQPLWGCGLSSPLPSGRAWRFQGALGASATVSGVIFALYIVATMAASVIGGRLLSRIEWHRPLAISGAGLTAIGLFLLSRMDGGTAQLEVLRNAIICGIGFGVLMPTYEVLVQNEAPAGTMGVATGITQFSRAVGGAIALALFGTMLLTLYHARMNSLFPPDATRELRLAFDDPLKLAFTKPNLQAAAFGVANARSVLQSLVEGARVGLMSALQSIFVASSAALAVSCALNMLIGRPPKQEQTGRRA